MVLIQLSDIHLCADPEALVRGNSPQQRFESAFDALAEETFDFLLLCGDISDDGSVESYQRVAAAADALQVAWGWIPGNHDDPATMAAVRPLLTEYWLPAEGDLQEKGGHRWRILGLNSWVRGWDGGELAPASLEWLTQCLSNDAAPTLVAIHHPPIDPAPARWMGEIDLRDQPAFWAAVEDATYPPKAILSGHIHMAVNRRHGDIPIYTSPGCIDQFAAHSDGFATDDELWPGFLRIRLADAQLASVTPVRFAPRFMT